MIHTRDTRDALGAAERQWRQLATEYTLPSGWTHAGMGGLRNVLFAGFGSDAFAADSVRSWLDIRVPFELLRGYDLPAYVGTDSLCIVSDTYSLADDVIGMVRQATDRGARVIIVSWHDRLAGVAAEHGLPLVRLPDAVLPRFGTWSVAKVVATILDATGLTDGDAANRLAAEATWLGGQSVHWRPDVATANNSAKQLALELAGKSVVVYAGPRLAPLAYRWRVAINQNARQLAWSGGYPGSAYDELPGWSKQPVHKPYAVVDIRSDLDDGNVQKQFEILEKMLSGRRPVPQTVRVAGDTLLQQLLWGSLFGDVVSVYLALLNGVDPMAPGVVEKLMEGLV